MATAKLAGPERQLPASALVCLLAACVPACFAPAASGPQNDIPVAEPVLETRATEDATVDPGGTRDASHHADAAVPDMPPPQSAGAPSPAPPIDTEDTQDRWFMPTSPLAARPPMGWSSWNALRCNVTAADIRGMADAMVQSGMKDAGYEYINIDDCWADHRDASGTIVAGANFPDGIAPVVAYIHDKGLKAGIYTGVGAQTCAGRPGSLDHAAQDAKTYAAWGIDYVKVDYCGVVGTPDDSWRAWRGALLDAGRATVFSIATAGQYNPWSWAPDVGQLWRTTADIERQWTSSILGILDSNERLAYLARPGAWNDPDMLQVGNGTQPGEIRSDAQNRTHFSLWAMMAAPLIAGNDLRTMPAAVRDLLTNQELIAVDQDPLGYQGYRVRKDEHGGEVWMKPLLGDAVRAVALFNRGSLPVDIEVAWSEIGLRPGDASVRDLFKHSELGNFRDSFRQHVEPDSTVVLRVTGTPPAAPRGAAYLSDLTATYASNYWGPVERDRSVNEQAGGDGRPLAIHGQGFDKGLGVHAGSLLRYRLAGRCQRFQAVVGIDDEVQSQGSVRFELWADGTRLFRSELRTSQQDGVKVDVDVTGKDELKLRVLPGEDDFNHDHADWADAQLSCTP